MVDEPSHREQIRIEQYRQAREDWRHYDKLIWATPTVVFAISGAILGLSYQFLKDDLGLLIVRVFLLVVLAIWVLTLLVALSKHRFFQKGRTDFFQQLEDAQPLEITAMETWKQKTKPRTWCERQTAYEWLFASVLLTLIFVLFAAVHTIWLVLTNMGCRFLIFFFC